jgi:hypothetical protein
VAFFAETLLGEHNDRWAQTNHNSYGYEENKIAQPALGNQIS